MPDLVDEVVQNLVSSLAHELSAPVAVIFGFAEMIVRADPPPAPDALKQYMEAILRASRYLGGLIETFADTRALHAGHALRIDARETDVDGFLREAISDLQQAFPTNPIGVQISAPVRCLLDQDRIKQVLTNLISNAAKFGPRSGAIEVSADGDERTVEIAVRDHGPGVCEEERESIFERFHRLDASVPGIGLGLYIVDGIVRAHGGTIRYEAPPDGGSRFVIRLPGASS